MASRCIEHLLPPRRKRTKIYKNNFYKWKRPAFGVFLLLFFFSPRVLSFYE
jgi:hypothetical protein